jgi:tetratricopeptide (TPR) repeat protein
MSRLLHSAIRPSLLVLLAGAFGSLVAASQADDQSLASIVESASLALRADDLEFVESQALSLLAATPSSDVRLRTTLRVFLAEARVGMGDASAALAALSECPKSSLDSVSVLEIRASALAILGRPQEAEKILERLVSRRESARAAHQLGTIRFERGDYRGALTVLELAVELEPEDYYSRVYAARARIELGELDRAREELVAEATRADSPELQYLLGRVEVKAKRLDEAVAHFRRALESQPDYLECVFALGGALRAGSKTDEARLAFTRFRKLHRTDWNRLQRASELAQACARAPKSSDAWLSAAQFHLSTKDGEAARTAAWNALRLDPKKHAARLVLARALRANGRYSAALVHLRKILLDQPRNLEAERELRDLVEKHARK